MISREIDLRIEEYKSLRAEILEHIKAIHGIELQTIFAVGALYWYGLSVMDERPYVVLGMLTVAFAMAILNLYRAKDRQNTIGNIAHYLRHVEDKYFTGAEMRTTYPKADYSVGQKSLVCFKFSGWENFIDNARPLSRSKVIVKSPRVRAALRSIFKQISLREHTKPVDYQDRIWPVIILGSFIVLFVYFISYIPPRILADSCH